MYFIKKGVIVMIGTSNRHRTDVRISGGRRWRFLDDTPPQPQLGTITISWSRLTIDSCGFKV